MRHETVEAAGYISSMDPLLLSLVPSLLLCVVIVIILTRKARMNLPPGPPGLPIIGHLHLLGTKPYLSLSNLSRKYGSLMSLRFGNVHVLVVSSPAGAELILKTHDNIFCSRTVPTVSAIAFEGKELLVSQPGPYFKFIRRIAASELFSSKRLHFFRPIISEEICALLQVVADNADCVHVRKNLYDATFSIISRMAISRRAKDLWCPSGNGPSSSLQNLLFEAIYFLGVQYVGDYIPCLAWMDLGRCVRRVKAISREIKAVWQEIIADRRRRRRTRGHEIKDVDFLDVLLTASTEGEVQISDLAIMAILTNVFAAGIDTSTLTIEWALAELLIHPRILQKAQQELEEVVGPTRLVQESDIAHLPYLRAIVKETMRLHPIAPLLVPHTALQDCKVSGYDIPCSTQAYINVWAIGRDPNVWEDPLCFYPERFLDSNVDVYGQHFELVPFGSGRRSCPALLLGLNNVHLTLSNLLHAFEWRSGGEIDLSEKFEFLMALKNQLVAKATLKLPTHLISGSQSA